MLSSEERFCQHEESRIETASERDYSGQNINKNAS